MPPSAVINVCRWNGAVLAMALAACSTAPPSYDPGVLSAAQLEVVKRVERAYRQREPEYPRLRDEAVQDRAVAGWLVRAFVVDVFRAREGRPLGKDEDLLRAAARIEDPVEARAVAEIVALGDKAVPVLVGDLLQHDQPQPRELGVELLARIGTPAVPILQDVARHGETRHRRAAARALGAIGVDATILAVLREMAADSDYTIRADALRSLRSGGAPARDLLLEHLTGDDDPFVRRVAAQSLARFPGPVAAGALVDFLERCKKEGDGQGEAIAQTSLQAIAGTRGPRTADAWRAFARGLTEPAGKGAQQAGR